MRVILISDVHVVGGKSPAMDMLVRFLDELEADALWVLGDLFHAAWDFGDVVTPGIAPALEGLSGLGRRGVRVGFVPGNHDFGLATWFERSLGAEVRPAHVRDLDGQRFLLAHGDEADATVGYALTRRILRGRPFRALVAQLGVERGSALLAGLAGASRDRPAPRGALLEAQARWADARMAQEGAAFAVLGHSHAFGETALPHGRLFNLGDWSAGPRWLEVTGGVPVLRGGEAQASTRESVS